MMPCGKKFKCKTKKNKKMQEVICLMGLNRSKYIQDNQGRAMQNSLYLGVMLSLLCSPMLSAKEPKFQDFIVKKTNIEQTKKLLLIGDAKRYKTLITELSKQSSNYAGHYVLESFGCGGGCQSIAAYNKKTGKGFLHPHDFGDCYSEKHGFVNRDYEIQENSRLLVLTGRRGTQMHQCEVVYYVVEGDQFKQIAQKWIYRD